MEKYWIIIGSSEEGDGYGQYESFYLSTNKLFSSYDKCIEYIKRSEKKEIVNIIDFGQDTFLFDINIPNDSKIFGINCQGFDRGFIKQCQYYVIEMEVDK